MNQPLSPSHHSIHTQHTQCDKGTGLNAIKKLQELPASWTSAARVNASAFLYQKVCVFVSGCVCLCVGV